TGLYNRQGLARRVREIGSQAYRERSALACVALGLEVPSGPQAELVVRRCTEALKTAARVSDVVGRLAVQEFAVVAPSTGPQGAVQLAQRLARSLGAAAAHSWPGAPALRLRAGYESVANVGYEPMEPMELLARATSAVRTGRSGRWAVDETRVVVSPQPRQELGHLRRPQQLRCIRRADTAGQQRQSVIARWAEPSLQRHVPAEHVGEARTPVRSEEPVLRPPA